MLLVVENINIIILNYDKIEEDKIVTYLKKKKRFKVNSSTGK